MFFRSITTILYFYLMFVLRLKVTKVKSHIPNQNHYTNMSFLATTNLRSIPTTRQYIFQNTVSETNLQTAGNSCGWGGLGAMVQKKVSRQLVTGATYKSKLLLYKNLLLFPLKSLIYHCFFTSSSSSKNSKTSFCTPSSMLTGIP